MRNNIISEYEVYNNLDGDFYRKQFGKKGILNIWFRKRQFLIKYFFMKYYRGGKILDIGCGNSLWNDGDIEFYGMDISENIIDFNKSFFSSFNGVVGDVFSSLPFSDNEFDFVITTEVLEHSLNYKKLIDEIARVAKKDAAILVSVPYSGFFSLWDILFPVRCFVKGWFFNDVYYKMKCGHKIKFSLKKITTDFERYAILEKKVLFNMTTFLVLRKCAG